MKGVCSEDEAPRGGRAMVTPGGGVAALPKSCSINSPRLQNLDGALKL